MVNRKTNWWHIFVLVIFSFFIGEGILFYTQEFKKDLDSLMHFPLLKIPEQKTFYLGFFEKVREDFVAEKIDFLEINLQEMKVKVYKNGLIEKEVTILAKGDSHGWGGSAVGLYKIITGGPSIFSAVANVYMPYAMNYYGKYYLHGEPYYYVGKKLISSVSGGCLRLKDEDAKTIYDLVELNMPVLVIDKERDGYKYPSQVPGKLKPPEISAQGFLVADLDSGYVFAKKDYQKQFPIASLTKLMTAIVVAENIDLKESILVRDYMLKSYGNTEGLKVGERFQVVELFYPLLVESSNDAAEVLSYFLGRDRTIKLMQEKARAILMQETNFVCPSGYEPENVSTAQDLFYLARYILNNRFPILEITKGKKVLSFGKINFDVEKLWNKNTFVDDPTFIGGKTGFIKSSKNTALFIFRFLDENNVERNIAIILLSSQDVKTDTQKIYIWLLENYFNKAEL